MRIALMAAFADCGSRAGSCGRKRTELDGVWILLRAEIGKRATDARGREEARRLRFSEGRSRLPMQTRQLSPASCIRRRRRSRSGNIRIRSKSTMSSWTCTGACR